MSRSNVNRTQTAKLVRLLIEKPHTVAQLVDVLQMSSSAVHHWLRCFEDVGIAERMGTAQPVYYIRLRRASTAEELFNAMDGLVYEMRSRVGNLSQTPG